MEEEEGDDTNSAGSGELVLALVLLSVLFRFLRDRRRLEESS